MIEVNESVLNALGDSLSKEIYLKRIDYSNGNLQSIQTIISSLDYGKQLVEFMESFGDRLYVFGAGIWGQELVKTWSWKYKFCGFIDNNESLQKKQVLGIPVYPLEVFKKENTAGIVVATRLYWKELCKQLSEENIDETRIFKLGKVQSELAKVQYFDLPDLKFKKNEIFVDAGAFDGETSVGFYEMLNNEIEKVILFEPDSGNAEKCKNNMEKHGMPYQIINKGIWSEEKTLGFYAIGNGGSCIVEEGDSCVEVTRLDTALKDTGATFIKMDIEGAEMEALLGGEEVIRKYRPKLAICVYHKKEDIDVIPRLLLKYNPNYKLYLRHYSMTEAETVLYAI